MDTWLMICMGIVFLAVAEYAVLLGMTNGKLVKSDEEKAAKHDLAKKIDSWALKIFIGLYVLIVGTYSYWIYCNI